jgi:hypothetical protein
MSKFKAQFEDYPSMTSYELFRDTSLNVWSVENEGKGFNFVHNSKKRRYTLHWEEEKLKITTLTSVTACAKPHTTVTNFEDWTSSSKSMGHDLCHAPHGSAKLSKPKIIYKLFVSFISLPLMITFDVPIYFPTFSEEAYITVFPSLVNISSKFCNNPIIKYKFLCYFFVFLLLFFLFIFIYFFWKRQKYCIKHKVRYQ